MYRYDRATGKTAKILDWAKYNMQPGNLLCSKNRLFVVNFNEIVALAAHVSPTGDEFAPYTCRIYAYAGSALLRLVHSFVYTGEPRSDFVAAVGLRLGLLLDTVDAYSFGGEHGQGVATKLTQGVYCPRWPRGVLSQGSSRYYTMHKWVDPRANAPVRITEGGRGQECVWSIGIKLSTRWRGSGRDNVIFPLTPALSPLGRGSFFSPPSRAYYYPHLVWGDGSGERCGILKGGWLARPTLSGGEDHIC